MGTVDQDHTAEPGEFTKVQGTPASPGPSDGRPPEIAYRPNTTSTMPLVGLIIGINLKNSEIFIRGLTQRLLAVLNGLLNSQGKPPSTNNGTKGVKTTPASGQ